MDNKSIPFAQLLAAVAHSGQMYGDEPYINHVNAVVSNIQILHQNESFDLETAIIVGYLHDTVEDTGLDLEDLKTVFGVEVAHSVSLVTKIKNLTYRENIQRIIDSGNITAMIVKLADNYANDSGDKTHMKPERRDRLNMQYDISIYMLNKALKRV